MSTTPNEPADYRPSTRKTRNGGSLRVWRGQQAKVVAA